MSALDFLSVSTSPAPGPQPSPARSTSTSTPLGDPGAFDALVVEKSQSAQGDGTMSAATADHRARTSADASASDDAGGDDWKTKDLNRDADANDASAFAPGAASTSAPAPTGASASDSPDNTPPQDPQNKQDAQDNQDSQNNTSPHATATSSLASFLWTLRHQGGGTRHHGGAKHAGRHHGAAIAGAAASSSQAQASVSWALWNLGAAVDPGAIGALAVSGQLAALSSTSGAVGVNGSAAGQSFKAAQGSAAGQGQGQVQSGAGPNAAGWGLDSSIEQFTSSSATAAQAGRGASLPISLGVDGATLSATAPATAATAQGQGHDQGHTQAQSFDVTLGVAVGADAARISGADAAATAVPQSTSSSASTKANAAPSATLTNFVVDASSAGVAAATQLASGQPGIGTGLGSAQSATGSEAAGTRDAAIGTNAPAEGSTSDAVGTPSKGLAPDVADAARRQAWSELARLLGSNQATTAGNGGGPRGANGVTAANAAGSGAAAGTDAAGGTGTAAETGAAAKAGAAAIAGAAMGAATPNGSGSGAASQASTGLAIVDSLSLASSSPQDKAGRAHANATETATDQANSFGADDRAASATLAASAFDGARAQTGHGDGDRSDAFAGFAAVLGRGAGDAIGTTTTTAFPLHPLTPTGTTAAPSTDAARTATVASGGALPAAFAQTDGGDAAQQVIRSMRLQWNGSVGEAQLRLEPEHLGQVLVSVRVDQGNVSATLHANSATAQQWIEAHQQDLRQALQDQGLRVTQFNVTTNPDDRMRRDGSPPQDQPRDHQQPARRRDQRENADGRTFEVRV